VNNDIAVVVAKVQPVLPICAHDSIHHRACRLDSMLCPDLLGPRPWLEILSLNSPDRLTLLSSLLSSEPLTRDDVECTRCGYN
jgi:hypothetical protein